MSRKLLCKLFLLVLGLAVLFMEVHCYYESPWTASELFKRCDNENTTSMLTDGFKGCPPRFLETILLIAATITLTLSVINFVASKWFWAVFSENVQKVDVLYHFLAAIFMLVASSCYLTSVQMIDSITIEGPQHFVIEDFSDKSNRHWLHRNEKLATGILGVLQAVLYGITAFILFRRLKERYSKPAVQTQMNTTQPTIYTTTVPVPEKENYQSSAMPIATTVVVYHHYLDSNSVAQAPVTQAHTIQKY